MRKRTAKLKIRIDDNKEGEEILLIFLHRVCVGTKQASVFLKRTHKN